MITTTELDRLEQIAQDTKKECVYNKHTGKWGWRDRDAPEACVFTFDTRLEALRDAVAPYLEDEEEEEPYYGTYKCLIRRRVGSHQWKIYETQDSSLPSNIAEIGVIWEGGKVILLGELEANDYETIIIVPPMDPCRKAWANTIEFAARDNGLNLEVCLHPWHHAGYTLVNVETGEVLFRAEHDTQTRSVFTDDDGKLQLGSLSLENSETEYRVGNKSIYVDLDAEED